MVWQDNRVEEFRDKEADAKLRQTILNCAGDLMGAFLYYDRKECEELPRGAIEQAISDGIITVDELLEIFRNSLTPKEN